MSVVGLNDVEWGELFHERAELLKIYCALKRVMDYKSGIAGVTYHISDSFFYELLYVDAVSGRKALVYDRGAIRAMLLRLVNIGVIERKKQLGKNVFKLVLAKSDDSVQKSLSPATAQAKAQLQPELEPEKTQSNVVVMRVSEKATAQKNPELEPDFSPSLSPPLTSIYKDIYTRVGDVHLYLRAFINERSLLNAHNRKLMAEWVKQELTQLELQDAVGRATQSTQGGGFGLAYLGKVVEQIINQRSVGGDDEKRGSSGKPGGEHGEAGGYLRRQSELARQYLEDENGDN